MDPHYPVRYSSWMYVQDAGESLVSFVGASRIANGEHPLRFGSARTHQLVVSDSFIVPKLIVATDALIGMGLSALATNSHDIEAMLAQGEVLALVPRS